MKAGFGEFCAACDRIRAARTDAAKRAAAEVFLSHADPATGALARALWTRGRPAPLSPAALAREACVWLGIPYDPVFKACREAVGNSAETVRLLAENLGCGGREQPDLPTVDAWLQELARCPDAKSRYVYLVSVWNRLPPREAYWFVRLTEAGGPRLGVAFEDDREAGTGVLQAVVLYTAGAEITLGVRAGEGFVPIGKTHAFPEAEAAAVRLRLKALQVDRFGPTSAYRPELVVEAEFGHLFRNTRTKAGWVLKSVRIRRILWESKPDSVADLATVEHLGRSRAHHSNQPS